MNKNMTALISCFARAYHYKNYKFKVFSDSIAPKLITDEEYNEISKNMIEGIHFFNSDYKGNDLNKLRYIVDNVLSPNVLGRSKFAEDSLKIANKIGINQILIFASGYDTLAYKYKNINVFELDKKNMLNDKLRRLNMASIDHSEVNYIESNFENNNWIKELLNSGYNKNKRSFCTLLGISYYLKKDEFYNLLKQISNIIENGSEIIFDYPKYDVEEKDIIINKFAQEALEEMKSKYTLRELEMELEKNNLLIYESLDSNDMNNQIFYNYNTLNPNNKIIASKGVGYLKVVKRV